MKLGMIIMKRDYCEIEKEIAEQGFFSEYLPPCFGLDDKVFMHGPPKKCDLINPYRFTMSRYSGNNARRSIFLPEVGSYVVARNYIRQHDIIKEIIEFTDNNDVSFSPIVGANDRVMRHEQSYDLIISGHEDNTISSDYIENIAKKIKKATGAKKVLKLDVSNCFSSFYMHMVPAIMLGLEETERAYRASLNSSDKLLEGESYAIYRKYRGLDEVIRQMNLNRTNGLLSGPLISRVIAEGILTRIDLELKEVGFKFSRYVDDYEVYIFEDNINDVINKFTRILKRYGFALNNEKTEVLEFPYYVVENLEKIFYTYTRGKMDVEKLIEMFNRFYSLEHDGTKGAIRFLLKSLEHKPIIPEDPDLYKSFLITIIGNDERSLIKACSLLITQDEIITLTKQDVDIVKSMLEKHIEFENDLEVLWLLHLLIKTGNKSAISSLIKELINSNNELAHIMLLRNDFFNVDKITAISRKASSWILLYELYVSGHITEDEFVSKLNLNKNLEMYRRLKEKEVHFCK